jgi:hypothetical protein
MNLIVKKGRIRELKQMLLESDYKIIKCFEAQLLKEQMPYDYEALIEERNAWRKEIEELEK